MRAYVIDGGFGFEHLKLTERPMPAPQRGEVLLRMRAASLNYRDLRMVTGAYNPAQPLPLVPLSDGVGEVVAVGLGVTRVAAGDRAAPILVQSWLAGDPEPGVFDSLVGGPLDGVAAEYAVFPEHGVVRIPAYLSDVEAATFTVAGVTAWMALTGLGTVRAGDWVLVQGTGGVAIFALQLAKLFGASVILISSSDAKLARAQALGADRLINYRTTPAWGALVRDYTGGRGVANVIEVGGAATLVQSMLAVRWGGQISRIGYLSGHALDPTLVPEFERQRQADPFALLIATLTTRIQGIASGHRADFVALLRAAEQHRLKPVVDRAFPFEELPAALAYLESGVHVGKVCLDFGAPAA
jgi:NADPH:quinone reductase-like Zn-dependent oxidoreductase